MGKLGFDTLSCLKTPERFFCEDSLFVGFLRGEWKILRKTKTLLATIGVDVSLTATLNVSTLRKQSSIVLQPVGVSKTSLPSKF